MAHVDWTTALLPGMLAGWPGVCSLHHGGVAFVLDVGQNVYGSSLLPHGCPTWSGRSSAATVRRVITRQQCALWRSCLQVFPFPSHSRVRSSRTGNAWGVLMCCTCCACRIPQQDAAMPPQHADMPIPTANPHHKEANLRLCISRSADAFAAAACPAGEFANYSRGNWV